MLGTRSRESESCHSDYQKRKEENIIDLELGSATVQITEKADGSYNLVITKDEYNKLSDRIEILNMDIKKPILKSVF